MFGDSGFLVDLAFLEFWQIWRLWILVDLAIPDFWQIWRSWTSDRLGVSGSLVEIGESGFLMNKGNGPNGKNEYLMKELLKGPGRSSNAARKVVAQYNQFFVNLLVYVYLYTQFQKSPAS